MISRKCCCTTSNTCCDPILKDQFVTLFDTELDSACPVSDQDLMVLKINRPGSQGHGREFGIATNTTPGGPGVASSGIGVQCPACCRECSRRGCECGPPALDTDTPYYDWGASAKMNIGAISLCGACCCLASRDEGHPFGCADTCRCFEQTGLSCLPAKGELQCPGVPACPFDGTGPEKNITPNNIPSSFKTFVKKFFKTSNMFISDYKVSTLGYLNTLDTTNNKKLKATEKQVVQNIIKGNFKNTRFKDTLEFLSRCKKCLQDNNIDIDCVDDESINCQNKNTNICENCSEECISLCDPIYGGTKQQIRNSELLLSNVNYQDNMLALDPELDTTDVYSGTKDVTNLVKSLNPGDYGNDVSFPDGQVPCTKCVFSGGNPAAPPIYFIYRYSSCNFIWYPPEYVFNYNRTPSQCPGYINPKGIRSCDYFFARGNNSFSDGAAGNSSLSDSCSTSIFDTPSNDCSRDYNSFPCQCTQFPHLSGGIYDTLQRRINISKRQFFGGYIAGKNPFLPKVKIAELGCCTCFTTEETNTPGSCSMRAEVFNRRRGKYLSYPKASGWGSSIQAIGIGCTEDRTQSPPGYNPNYNTSCFSRGISPYLSRISISLYTLAFDIFHYGSDNPAQQETLGATYRSASILEDGKKWTALRFTKMYNKKDSLYNKLVGIVSLEHHFESWAYHSKAPFSPQPPLLMNHGLILLTDYERPYAGFISPCSFRYEPRAAMRWQIQHYLPRTVMYGSSGVPIFFSDLYAFEHLSREKNILIDGETFNGSKFLEQYYLYFYNNIIKPSVAGEPYVEPIDVSMYEYVKTCLTEMIRYNIISIKDHAKDIADELIEILDQITVQTIEDQSVVVFPDNFIKTQIGGSAGYNYMITFLKRLVGFDVGNNNITDWASLKPYITAKVIKRMINPNSVGALANYKKVLPGPMFRGPRRVKLIPTPISSGLTAWGCDPEEGCSSYNPSPLDIQSNVNLVYSSVHTNDMGTNFAITVNGKVQITGNNSLPVCNTDTDSNNFRSSLGCVPRHLSYVQDLLQDPNDAAPGNIEKISCKGKFAVALVTYGAFPIGYHLGDNGSVANRILDSNSGVEWVSTGPSDPNYGGIYRSDTPTFGWWGVYPSCPGYGYGVNDNTFALKTWGPDNKYGVFYNPPGQFYFCPSSEDEFIRPQGNSNTMPLKNRYRLWVDVAAGAKHCVAITGDGCLFVTPESDNTYNQSSYGKAPTEFATDNSLAYIANMPVPGYFKDIEWNATSLSVWRETNCSNTITYDQGPNGSRRKCDIRCYLYSVNYYRDLNYYEDGTPGYADITPDRPFYTNVGAGQYHSIAVSSDQNLKVWGSYVKVDHSGNILGPNQQDRTGNTGINPIPAFAPTNLINPDSWTLGGITLGCRGDDEDNPDNYVYTTAKKAPATIKIFQVDGGPDYSLAVTGSGTPVNVIIWGHTEMVSALNNTEISGLTGSDTKSYNYIEKIIAGVNSFGVLYRRQNNAQKYLDIFTRPSRTAKSYDFGVDKLPYTEYDFEDAALSYGHAIGIVNSGFRINTWKQSSFNTFTGHNLLQFKSTGDLPLYFQSQAFFRCVKGHWDFSKWLFGRSCKSLGAEQLDNEVLQQDKCSIYWKKGEGNLCYTGHPKYYWMKPNDRRYQKVTPLHTRDPQEDGTGCGLMRDELGDDGLGPFDYGTENGAATTGDVNSQLTGLIGGCYSGRGDICWMGDGLPAAYQYRRTQAQLGSGFRCDCEEPCGCPPESAIYYRYECDKDLTYLGEQCFSDGVYGRSGFSSNKDFFVQSHKYFGRTRPKCCGVVDTNITYFYYAKKCFYYGYNSTTGLYEVKDAPLKYRSYYWGEGRTGASANQIIGVTSAIYMNYTMTPEDCIVSAYQVDYYMQYPTVYVGGARLRPLKLDFASSVNIGSRGSASCGTCSCNANDVCDPTNTCTTCGETCKDINAGQNLLGPGGWIYNPGALCSDGTDGIPTHRNGTLSTSIALFDDTLYFEAGASTYLGPLVKFGPYNGSLPPGFTATCYTGPACPCPNYEAQCDGCKLKCNANAVYSVLEEYDIDDLTKYNLVGDKITYTQEQSAKLFRVYEELKSVWVPTGATYDPIAFQGGWDIPGNQCPNNPTPQSMDVDKFYGFLKYEDGNTGLYGIASDLTCIAMTD